MNIRMMTLIASSMLLFAGCMPANKKQKTDINLNDNWKIQQSAKVDATGEGITSSSFSDAGWIDARVPSTIMGILAGLPGYENILMADQYYSADKKIFDGSWWYRTAFELPSIKDKSAALLQLDGISYYANIWLNGVQIASRDTLFGTFRRFEIDVTAHIKKGDNHLAVEVFRQREGDFGLGFVDWNPRPLDENMGVWRDVTVKLIDRVQLKNTFVRSKVNTHTLDEAWLTVGTTLRNFSNEDINGFLKIELEGNSYQHPVNLKPGTKKEVILTSDQIAGLYIKNPRLWWSAGLGKPDLYDLEISFDIDNKVESCEKVTFGIRQIEDYFNAQGQRGYKINGKEILIKGAGWTDEIFLRDTPESNETQVEYVKHMGLNTIRFETIWGTNQNIYDLCDKHGILAMVGWSCQWEWENYLGKACDEFGGITTTEDIDLVLEYTRDQVTWLRNHPSIFVWLVGSDMLPRPEMEKQYIDLFNQIDDRPWLGAASWRISELTGSTGVKMHGPYEYVGPSYWYIDKKYGGAYGFNTETGPGPQLPVKTSIKKMLPDDRLWPLNPAWDKHCTTAGMGMNSVGLLNDIVTEMWGEAKNFDDFVLKSHLVNYDAMRAMFEAFRVNRPVSTGIIQWMLNSAWPSFYWQLYDYYLIPTPAYYATKKALEPIQLIYDYRAKSIVVSNESLDSIYGSKAIVSAYSIQSDKIWEKEVPVSIAGNSVHKLIDLPKWEETVFLKLEIFDAEENLIADNFYWLSDKEEVFDWTATYWIHTPMKSYSDFKPLQAMDEVKLEMDATSNGKIIKVNIDNNTDNISLFNQLKLHDGNGEWIVPVFFSDNYFSLAPGSSKTIEIELPKGFTGDVNLELTGWNSVKIESTISL